MPPPTPSSTTSTIAITSRVVVLVSAAFVAAICVAVGVGATVVGVGVGVGDSDGVGENVVTGGAVVVRVSVGRGERVRVRVGVGVGVEVGVGVGVSVGSGVSVGVGSGVGVQSGRGVQGVGVGLVWTGAGDGDCANAAVGAHARAPASTSPPSTVEARRIPTPGNSNDHEVNQPPHPRVLGCMIDTMASRDAAAGRVVAGDDALVDLYRAHYRSLVRLASLLLDDIGTSEEVVQDAYIRMHGAWRRIKDPDKALPYLRTTVVNLSRSRMRHRQVAERHAPKPMPDAASAEYGAIAASERDAVVAALRELPPKQREALVLRFYGDLSETEIAATMGVSQGAVKSHLHRGKAALAKHLEPQS
jgi:RNA polymerase sigma-70 factor (sigma-E family)